MVDNSNFNGRPLCGLVWLNNFRNVCTSCRALRAYQASASDTVPLDMARRQQVHRKSCYLDMELVPCHRDHQPNPNFEPHFSVAVSIRAFCLLSIGANASLCAPSEIRPEILPPFSLCSSGWWPICRRTLRIRLLWSVVRPARFPVCCQRFLIL